MIHAKNYETVSTFVSYSEKTTGFFFSGHGVHQQLLDNILNCCSEDSPCLMSLYIMTVTYVRIVT